jgi:hypothetical protein
VREVLPDAAAGLVAAMAGEGDLAGHRFARGCRVFAASIGGEVAAYGWLSSRTEWIGEIRLELTPEAGAAYVWNCLTLPAYRRRGMFRAVVVRISSVLREEGVARLWIASGGGGAEKALPDAGYRQVLKLAEAQLPPAGLRLLRVTGIPGTDPGLVSAARRVLAGGERTVGSTALARRPGPRRH